VCQVSCDCCVRGVKRMHQQPRADPELNESEHVCKKRGMERVLSARLEETSALECSPPLPAASLRSAGTHLIGTLDIPDQDG
jgi:hypothetical protein